jgi:hypothetical protein
MFSFLLNNIKTNNFKLMHYLKQINAIYKKNISSSSVVLGLSIYLSIWHGTQKQKAKETANACPNQEAPIYILQICQHLSHTEIHLCGGRWSPDVEKICNL